MGQTLNGTQINNTYSSLLKTTDNAAIDATLKNMTDGEGNATPLSMGTNYIQLSADTIELIEPTGGTNLIQISPTETYFEGTVNFVNATVNGLPSGGLELGTGSATQEGAPLSMQSASSVTTIAAQARGGGDIALGDNANTKVAGTTWPSSSIAIGHNASTTAEKALAIGRNATNTGERGMAIGYYATAGANSVALGVDSKAPDAYGIAIGRNSDSGATSAVAIGNYAGFLGPFAANAAVMIGKDNGFSAGAQSISIGLNTTGKATDSIAIGYDARVDSSAHTAAICIGEDTRSGAAGAVALGRNITASKEDTVSVNELETQLNGGGITMFSPNGTEYKVTVTDAGALLVTAI